MRVACFMPCTVGLGTQVLRAPALSLLRHMAVVPYAPRVGSAKAGGLVSHGKSLVFFLWALRATKAPSKIYRAYRQSRVLLPAPHIEVGNEGYNI